jgi:hypothetical protein
MKLTKEHVLKFLGQDEPEAVDIIAEGLHEIK